MTVKQARETLGKRADNLSDLEVQQIISRFEYLAETWLDKVEKNMFKGLTITELTID